MIMTPMHITFTTFSCRLLTLFTCLLIYSSTSANAAPWPVHVRHSTHRVQKVGKRGLTVEMYHPKSTFKTFGTDGINDGSAQPPVMVTNTSYNLDVSGAVHEHRSWALNTSSMNFVRSQLGLSDPSKLGYKSGYSGDVAKFAYIRQYHEGIPFANAVANVAYNSNNKVVSFGSSFITVDKSTTIAPSTPSVAWESVLPHIEDSLSGQYNNHTPSLEYLVRPDGSISLAHVVQIQNEAEGRWYEAYICAHSGKLLSVTDFVAHATYTVLPIQKVVLDSGLETLTDPEDLFGSPHGWHSDGITNTSFTLGNNVMAFKTSPTSQRIVANQSSDGLNFRYTFNDNQDPTDPNNIAASNVNAFYIANTVHDVAYRYGFTEDAFNFQFDNLGRGGGNAKAQDGVLVSIQDLSGVNNANFATPPDGQSGICRMFIWNLTSPRRDGAVENDILVHELTHGITNRMTGGGTGRCLQTTEAAGLGEGWSDAMADWIQHTDATVPDFAVGTYVTENNNGIRHFPYSTNATVNPLTYSHLQGLTEPHNIGEVWANMLHNVYAVLVQERGFSSTAMTNPDGQEGNVVYMRMFIDALALQPCNPTFVAARDAWIQADQNRYKGTHRCELFRAFASRGLGAKAQDNFVDDQSVPDDCNS